MDNVNDYLKDESQLTNKNVIIINWFQIYSLN